MGYLVRTAKDKASSMTLKKCLGSSRKAIKARKRAKPWLFQEWRDYQDALENLRRAKAWVLTARRKWRKL